MGSTMSLLFIENRDFTHDELAQLVDQLSSKENQKEQAFITQIQHIVTPTTMNEAERRQVESLFQNLQVPKRPKTVLAYNDNMQWLPLFVESLCEGNIVSSKALVSLSQRFQTPVFAFAIYDSDVLLVSYCDAKKDVLVDYIKPNCQEFEGYENNSDQDDFPQLLLDLCDSVKHERLLAIWNETDVIFADDRMERIAELLEMNIGYDFYKDTSDFQRILPK